MVHVVVGLLFNSKKELLVTQRPLQKSYSGYWEFPGGKKEANESAWEALVRELKEELDLDIHSGHPWKTLNYVYPEKTVDLDLWIVTDFSREPQGMEEQAFQWVALNQLNTIDFLPANKLVLAEVIEIFS